MISAWDCFRFATLELVRSTPIKQRLVCAYRRHLAALPAEQVPEDVRGFYQQVEQALSGVAPQRGEDAVSASVRKMSNQDADDCAALIVEIFGMMSRGHADAARAEAARGAAVLKLQPLDCGDYDLSAVVAAR